MSYPQMTVIGLMVFTGLMSLIADGNTRRVSFEHTMLSILVWALILGWGGFWK